MIPSYPLSLLFSALAATLTWCKFQVPSPSLPISFSLFPPLLCSLSHSTPLRPNFTSAPVFPFRCHSYFLTSFHSVTFVVNFSSCFLLLSPTLSTFLSRFFITPASHNPSSHSQLSLLSSHHPCHRVSCLISQWWIWTLISVSTEARDAFVLILPVYAALPSRPFHLHFSSFSSSIFPLFLPPSFLLPLWRQDKPALDCLSWTLTCSLYALMKSWSSLLPGKRGRVPVGACAW